MSIRVALHHITTYTYQRPVTLFPQVVRLRPAPHCRTPIHAYSLRVQPERHFVNWQQDPQGNYQARLVFPDRADRFVVEVDLVAEMAVINPFDFFLESSAECFPFAYEPWLSTELRPFLERLPVGPRLGEWLASTPREPMRTVDFLVELNRRLKEHVRYVIRLEPGVQTPEETLALACGSCRDSAWLLVQIMRNLGLAARFVSGYLIQLAPDVKPLDGPVGPSADFTDLHAWTEVFLPGAGWVGLDPTSGLLAGEGHIPVACTPEPSSAAPISGGVEPCQSQLEHCMSVERIHESPRVTRPYTEEQWCQIEALGHRIDADLQAHDVRLTMGGEPTFVSIDDMDGAEWNTTALGPAKRRLAGDLVKRLRRRFAPGGFLHYGQGKWYPGEPLPRWALSCYWRKDGEPIWGDEHLIDDEDSRSSYDTAAAQQFIGRLAERLQVGSEHVIAAYEDVWHYLWRERRLPTNIDPLESNLDDPLERARLARVFEQGLGNAAGFALPLQPFSWSDGRRWRSGDWFLRREHMFLLPGDSPLGFRLPLDSLPWTSPAARDTVCELDPFAPRPPLARALPRRPQTRPEVLVRMQPDSHGSNGHLLSARRRRHLAAAKLGHGLAEPDFDLEEDEWPSSSTLAAEPSIASLWRRGESAAGVVRTALCVEPRGGKLHVFMPPVGRVEEYLDLIGTVEQTAFELNQPVVIEGYPPPQDHRLNHFRVTPDPGVLEVNIHAAASWDELVSNTTGLYEEARQARLATEKFMLDGRHAGTGGGNHVVIGGPTAADSPILRRPDLLRSLVAYWNNHPALSYLFSGMFVGPTSQSPRIDEARHDSLYELELAFAQVPERASCPPWLVDRLFRNLLIDVTGNTHRAEFCIDKLFSPDAAGGRLGLVEFRAFEMPPHARMSLTQQLLLRTLIAWFWQRPYSQRLIRWGTSLHDQFMLPHFVEKDFADVIEDVNRAGYPLQHDWFAPHLEFRFPLIGEICQRGVHLELRHAIEPWHVLGEEAAAGGTSRYVDSSLERLQVKLRGATDPRHVLCCNGRRVPLHPTGTVGEFVAGVRYRAWQPPNCLHPTIGIHTPLAFDLYDTWSGRSIGGCTWHVTHPGGRSYDRFPVNAYEAESRRVGRFFQMGHTPGSFVGESLCATSDFPMTLDLRQG